MNEERYILVFVRTDIPLAMQLVSCAHATYHLAKTPNDTDIPNIIIIGCRSLTRLLRVGVELIAAGVYHYAWSDPDTQDGVTALATRPLSREEKIPFQKYHTWSE